jgi:hypothetical protein
VDLLPPSEGLFGFTNPVLTIHGAGVSVISSLTVWNPESCLTWN